MFESIDRGFDMLDQHSGDWTKSCGLSRDLMGGILVKSCADFFAARLIILPVHHEASPKTCVPTIVNERCAEPR